MIKLAQSAGLEGKDLVHFLREERTRQREEKTEQVRLEDRIRLEEAERQEIIGWRNRGLDWWQQRDRKR